MHCRFIVPGEYFHIRKKNKVWYDRKMDICP
jgi:hypothetical protein